MALRTFADPSGRQWQVWDTRPQTEADERRFSQNARAYANLHPRAGMADGAPEQVEVETREQIEEGWLTFLADGEKRRLSPIPNTWAHASDPELRALCERATPVDQRVRAD